VAVVCSLPERVRNGDAHYVFRQHSDLIYLTGFEEPEAALVLRAGAEKEKVRSNAHRTSLSRCRASARSAASLPHASQRTSSASSAARRRRGRRGSVKLVGHAFCSMSGHGFGYQ
jgi:hypothetical protein